MKSIFNKKRDGSETEYNTKDNNVSERIDDKVAEYKDQRISDYNKEQFEEICTLNSGGLGEIHLYKSTNSEDMVVKKELIHNKNNLKSMYDLRREANITDKIGTLGAISRAKRRFQKGYELDIRLSAPQVFEKEAGFCMEFMSKGDLTKYHYGIDTYEMLKQTSKLVNDLHTNGYIHRDIKPHNLLVGEDNKIRLADLDSVVKIQQYNPNYTYNTFLYANMLDHIKKTGNRKKVDIYSVAVSTIAYTIGMKKFTEATRQFLNYIGGSKVEKSMNLRDYYINIARNFKDKQLGKILENMLSGKYRSMNMVLTELDKINAVKDKKDLKIALSYLTNEKAIDEICNALDKRLDVLAKDKIPQEQYKKNVSTMNTRIANLLVTHSARLDTSKRKHVLMVVKKFRHNKFTNFEIYSTKDALKRQRKKEPKSNDHLPVI